MVEFKSFPKIHRYSRSVIVTEKLDGTNACVIIENGQLAGAQSRNRIITPTDDNYGFAAWAYTHGKTLSSLLGDGYHYGEWWGQGIQRGYGKNCKEFSLFNVGRWEAIRHLEQAFEIGLSVVPEIWRGKMEDLNIDSVMNTLKTMGSLAAPNYMNPEGIVVFHSGTNGYFKKTFEHDESGKGQEAVAA